MGAIARHLASLFFPSSLFVNVLGSFLMGIWIAHPFDFFGIDSERWKWLFVVGFLGSFTTFSAFSKESYEWIIHQEYTKLCFMIFAQVSLSLFFLWVGTKVVRLVL